MIIRDEADQALTLLESQYPQVLTDRADLVLRLHCQVFMRYLKQSHEASDPVYLNLLILLCVCVHSDIRAVVSPTQSARVWPAASQ